MKSIKSIGVFAILLFVAGCEYLPFSFGALDGRPAAPLSDWREIADVDIVQFETLREGEAYSVNIWMIAEETHLYVYGGDNEAQWAVNLEANPQARIQANDMVYEFSGSRVTNEEEFAHFAQLWLHKYSSDRTDSTASGTFLYRLDPAGA